MWLSFMSLDHTVGLGQLKLERNLNEAKWEDWVGSPQAFHSFVQKAIKSYGNGDCRELQKESTFALTDLTR